MNRIKLIFLTILTVNGLYSQNAGEVIKKTAIECKDWTVVNQNIYTALKDYKFICLGEMHGTNEPAEFLTGLVRTFRSNNRSVIVGFEIDDYFMKDFIYQPDSAGLSNTIFFFSYSEDGRNSKAWFNAIKECNKLGVLFCYFDNSSNDRDLGMYEKLLEYYQADTSRVVLTLSGNVHNKLVPFNGFKTMACYLKERFGTGVCSINHIYNGGTMYNRTADGLKIHTLEPTNSIFSSSTSYDSYYLPNAFTIKDYSGFFYTRTMTASLPWTKK